MEGAKREEELRRPVPGSGGSGGVWLVDLVASFDFGGLGDGAADEVLVDREGLRERGFVIVAQKPSASMSMAVGSTELGVGGLEVCGRLDGAERGEFVVVSGLCCWTLKLYC